MNLVEGFNSVKSFDTKIEAVEFCFKYGPMPMIINGKAFYEPTTNKYVVAWNEEKAYESFWK
jgi:hypothetical protein